MNIVNIIIIYIVLFIFVFLGTEFLTQKFNSENVEVSYKIDIKENILISARENDFVNIGNLTLKKENAFNSLFELNEFIFCITNGGSKILKGDILLVLKEDYEQNKDKFGIDIKNVLRKNIRLQNKEYLFYVFMKKDLDMLKFLPKGKNNRFLIYTNELLEKKVSCRNLVKEDKPITNSTINSN